VRFIPEMCRSLTTGKLINIAHVKKKVSTEEKKDLKKYNIIYDETLNELGKRRKLP
jgi:hypothetical protein